MLSTSSQVSKAEQDSSQDKSTGQCTARFAVVIICCETEVISAKRFLEGRERRVAGVNENALARSLNCWPLSLPTAMERRETNDFFMASWEPRAL